MLTTYTPPLSPDLYDVFFTAFDLGSAYCTLRPRGLLKYPEYIGYDFPTCFGCVGKQDCIWYLHTDLLPHPFLQLCTSNQDCDARYLCDVFTGKCLLPELCGRDEDCLHGQVCDKQICHVQNACDTVENGNCYQNSTATLASENHQVCAINFGIGWQDAELRGSWDLTGDPTPIECFFPLTHIIPPNHLWNEQ